MTISTETSSIVYTGNASTTEFPFSWKQLTAAELVVSLFDIATETTIVLPTAAYSVVMNADLLGGTVTYNPADGPMPNTKRLVLQRVLPYVQPIVLQNQTRYYPDVVEQGFDRLCMQVQQLRDEVQLKVGSTPGSDSPILYQDLLSQLAQYATAAEAAAAAAALYTPGYFNTLADLLADDTLWPNGQILNTRSEGYVYEAAPPAATDHHLTNAGGKKLYVSTRNRSVTPRMFGAVGDGTADDLLAIRAAWDFAGANKVPCFMEGLEYNCSDAVFTSSNLTVMGGGAVMYNTAWPALGGFINNVRPVAADRVQSNIRFYDLIADGLKLPAPVEQNSNLIGFARGASNVRVVNCTGRRMRDGTGGGTGGGAFGIEQGGHDIHFIGCVAEDCYRGFRVAAVPGEWSPGVSKEATGIVVRDFVARRCGTAVFAHSVGHDGDDQSDLAVFDTLFDGCYFEDCGHYPWREFDFAANPLIAAQKTGIITLGGAQNVRMRGIRVKTNSGFPASFTDWLGRTGYPASGNYIGAGLSGPVGALVWGWGRNVVIEDVTLDGSVDAYWKCARAITFGDLATVTPTGGADGTVAQIVLEDIRHVRPGVYNYVFDGTTGADGNLDNSKVSARVTVVPGANPTLGVIGPNGTAALSNLIVKFVANNGPTQQGNAMQWLAAGNARPSGAEFMHEKAGYDFGGGYSASGTKKGQSYAPDTGILRSSQDASTAAYHLALYNPSGLVGGIQSIDSRTQYRFTQSQWISGGDGTPEGVVTAPVGCVWIRTNGTGGSRVYFKATGSSNTGWVAIL